jgi:hypothetical protein
LLFPQNFALRVIEIESYLRSPFLVWKHRLQKMIISDDFDKKYIRIFLPIVLLLITLDFILIFFGIKLKLWLLYGSKYYLVDNYYLENLLYDNTKKTFRII